MRPGTIIFVPPSTRHIVISPVDCLAFGSFTSHVYGALSDLANYLDVHRKSHPDLPVVSDAKCGLSVKDALELAGELINVLRNNPKDVQWDPQQLKEIYTNKKESFVSKNRALQSKLNDIANLCS